MKNKPDFFVVGAAKSGTTALWSYFQNHPEVFVTSEIQNKELGYFSPDYGINDSSHYFSYFKNAKKDQKIGEVCHAYLSTKESASLIKKEIPNAKIIIILRNPINRAYSLYNWMVMNGYEPLNTFEKALKHESKRGSSEKFIKSNKQGFIQNYLYFLSGLYFEQVKRYFDIFNRENVLVLSYEEFRENQEKSLNQIYDFLEVKKMTGFEEKKVNLSKSIKVPVFNYIAKQYLLKKQSKVKLFDRLCNKIGRELIKWNKTDDKPKKMKEATYKSLKEAYCIDVEKLSDLTSKNFTKLWMN